MILEAENNRLRRDRNERMSLAWHIEALARQKKLPRHKDFIKEDSGPTGRRMAPEQMQATIRGWLASRHRKN